MKNEWVKPCSLLVAAVLLLTGCSQSQQSQSIIDRQSYGVDVTHKAKSVNERVRFLILHYTATDDARSLKILTDGEVSSHYLVTSVPTVESGKPIVLQLVPEDKRAWHAGASYWSGRYNLNDTSIGIEIVNKGYTTKGSTKQQLWYPYHPRQIELVTRMAKDIIERYQITPDNVLGHSDISPQRKQDPGPLFPWEQLAKAGVGAWPDSYTVTKYLAGRPKMARVSVVRIQQALEKYGYEIPQTGFLDDETRRVLTAFQMHFRPSNIDGNPDAETEAITLALLEKYRA